MAGSAKATAARRANFAKAREARLRRRKRFGKAGTGYDNPSAQMGRMAKFTKPSDGAWPRQAHSDFMRNFSNSTPTKNRLRAAGAKRGAAYAKKKFGSAIPEVKAPTRQKAMGTKPVVQRPTVANYGDMGPGGKIRAAATMYGTGSKQHQAAIKRFSPKH